MISRVCTGKPYTFAMFSAHALHGKWGTVVLSVKIKTLVSCIHLYFLPSD